MSNPNENTGQQNQPQKLGQQQQQGGQKPGQQQRQNSGRQGQADPAQKQKPGN